jgi:hypothetical protein
MPALNLKPGYTAVATGALAAVLAAGAFAGPPMRTAPHTTATPATTLHSPAATAKTAASNTHTTGQPNQSCGSSSAPHTPGNAAAAPGSAFNPNGKAGTVYAGQQPQNSHNPKSVSQYDVACSHQR